MPQQGYRQAVLGGRASPRRERGQDRRFRKEEWCGASSSVGWDSATAGWRGHKGATWREALPRGLGRSEPGEAGRCRQEDWSRASGWLAWGSTTHVWRGEHEANWKDSLRERGQAESSRPSPLLPEGNRKEVRLRSKHGWSEQKTWSGWSPQWSTASSSAPIWRPPERHCRGRSSEEQAKERKPPRFRRGDNRFAHKEGRAGEPGRQFACDSSGLLQGRKRNRLPGLLAKHTAGTMVVLAKHTAGIIVLLAKTQWEPWSCWRNIQREQWFC